MKTSQKSRFISITIFCFCILLSATFAQTTIDVRVSQSTDDVEETVSNGDMSLNNNDLELGGEDGVAQVIGLRFINHSIPDGATITNAYIQFFEDEQDEVATSLTIRGQSTGSFGTFVSTAYDASSRATTTSSVAWNNVPSWMYPWDSGADHRTPDLSTIVQEIVNSSSWNSGDPLIFVIDGSGQRTAESWDTDPNLAPLLHVVYTTGGGDSNPPSPNPMTFATTPYATGSTTISMTATTATDPSSPVEYFFECTAGGGPNSAWQSNTTFIATGLTASTSYSYRVRARDSVGNITTYSQTSSATTDSSPDTDPPTPNPMTFATAPYATGSTTISMTASTATDASSPVEYYFECVTGSGPDSQWQTSTSFIATNLTPSTTYSYRVRSRDSVGNVTTYSASASATTTAASTQTVWEENTDGSIYYGTAEGGNFVGIGTDTPQSKLAVNGEITAREVTVTTSGWADFIFKPEYCLPTLSQVEQHIHEKGHLPDIPSAAEVEANGVSVGEMQAKLLQKIEELTLYTLQQQKLIEAQQKQINALLEKKRDDI